MTSKERKERFIKSYSKLFHIEENIIENEINISGITKFFENKRVLSEESQKEMSEAILELTKILPLIELDKRTVISSSKELSLFVHDILPSKDYECIMVIYTDFKNQVIDRKVSTIGTQSSSLVNFQDIYKTAMELNASRLFLAHNHPSGALTPSQEDRNITKKMIEIGQFFDIPLIEHIIIDGRNPNNVYSFRKEESSLFDNYLSPQILARYDEPFEAIKNKINLWLKENPDDFIKAFISIETGIEEKEKLNDIYQAYMNKDEITGLLNEQIYDLIPGISNDISVDYSNEFEELKGTIIRWINQNYAEEKEVKRFNEYFPNLKEIGLAYTQTPDQQYNIQVVLDLEEYKILTYVDDFLVESYECHGESKEEKCHDLISVLNFADFDEMIRIESENLKDMGLDIDDDGNFFRVNEYNSELSIW